MRTCRHLQGTLLGRGAAGVSGVDPCMDRVYAEQHAHARTQRHRSKSIVNYVSHLRGLQNAVMRPAQDYDFDRFPLQGDQQFFSNQMPMPIDPYGSSLSLYI